MPTPSSAQSTRLMSSLVCGHKAKLPLSIEHVWPADSTSVNLLSLEVLEEPTR